MRPVRCLVPVLLLCAASAIADDAALDACASDAEAPQWLARVNALREAGAPCDDDAPAGRPPLAWEPLLARSARELASDLAQRDALTHVDARGRTLDQRLRAAGYQSRSAAENLGAGQESFDTLLRAWLASRPHCRNVMDAAFTQIGVACVQRRDAARARFWVAQFGAPRR